MAVVSVECPQNIVTYSLVLVANNNVRHVDTAKVYIRVVFRSGTDPISLLILLFFLFLLERRSSKKSKAPSFQIGSGLNVARLFFR